MKQEFNWRDYDNYNEWLHDVLEALTESIEEKDKEIERLKDLCNKYEEEHKTAFEEWKKAINIIKEVREYIEKNLENTSQTLRFDENKSYNTALLELKEILDKEKE